ncbi:DUF3168 domain-containing protein [Fretibacter rubidus]|uniref:DUF3168 domain-containing protein n=1 Tax=Fretibacter rubidus TaxID=570162 RepID=UPI00352A031D
MASHTDPNGALSLSRGLYDLLSNSLIIQSQLGEDPRLYDHAPDDPVFPYLTFGPLRSEDASGQGGVITNHLQTLHLWSRYAGRAEMLSLIGAVSRVLIDGDLTVEDGVVVNRHILLTDIFRATDGLTLHGVIRLRITTDQELETS